MENNLRRELIDCLLEEYRKLPYDGPVLKNPERARILLLQMKKYPQLESEATQLESQLEKEVMAIDLMNNLITVRNPWAAVMVASPDYRKVSVIFYDKLTPEERERLTNLTI